MVDQKWKPSEFCKHGVRMSHDCKICMEELNLPSIKDMGTNQDDDYSLVDIGCWDY